MGDISFVLSKASLFECIAAESLRKFESGEEIGRFVGCVSDEVPSGGDQRRLCVFEIDTSLLFKGVQRDGAEAKLWVDARRVGNEMR